ncbi:DNA-processing protein DprA [Bacillus tianshenii]|nr:DNA-processing protein DprA [Bacillus tianshenii]
MLNIRERLIYLHSCQGVYWRTLHRFLEYDPTLKEIENLQESTLIHHFHMNPTQARTFLSSFHSGNPHQLMSTYSRHDIQILTIFDDDYPPLLKQIYDTPWVLYMKGNRTIIANSKLFSVVGTRKPTSNGVESLKKVLPSLIENGYSIVSGLAYGIDTTAHYLTHQLGGKTVAVLGSGFFHIYPKKHLSFAETLAKEHILLSEYPPYTQPRRWHFPARNRIISGLSRGLLVVEAKKRSGSLITADQALEQGREVFAVPGSILEPNAEGTNHLIQQGAKLVHHSEDILSELPE